MSVPCEEIRPELEALLGAMTEGALEAERRKRLNAILREHPEARQYYFEYCQMHALLESAHGVLHALERPAARRRWAIAAAAGLLVAAGLLLLNSLAPSRLGASFVSSGPAWVVRDGRRLAAGDAGPMVEGDRLVTGAEARTEVRLQDGTKLSLSERTDLRFERNRMQLLEGSFRCEAAPQPPGRPLVFIAKHAEATVLGTVFDLSSTQNETRLQTLAGRVRFSAEGRELEVKAGEIATADGLGIVRWRPVCSYDFAAMKELPPQFETVYCKSDLLHTAGRKIEASPERLRLVPGGLTMVPNGPGYNGLVVSRWKEEVGDDVLMEAEVVGGERWSLGFSVGGDSFEGYRIIFAILGYPNGISIDTIHPVECIVLASDPRNISYGKDHVLRVESRGGRMRVWIDRELRLDTVLEHKLPEGRKRTFALSNFGAPPLIRSLRVWNVKD